MAATNQQKDTTMQWGNCNSKLTSLQPSCTGPASAEISCTVLHGPLLTHQTDAPLTEGARRADIVGVVLIIVGVVVTLLSCVRASVLVTLDGSVTGSF